MRLVLALLAISAALLGCPPHQTAGAGGGGAATLGEGSAPATGHGGGDAGP
jgi:hypothetical protein